MATHNLPDAALGKLTERLMLADADNYLAWQQYFTAFYGPIAA